MFWLDIDDLNHVVLKNVIESRLGLAPVQTPTDLAPLISPADDYLVSFVDLPEQPIDSEINLFLNNPDKNFAMLHKYPSILKLFIRYNTTLPSSAPVERLFSAGSIVLTARKTRLNDFLLEHLILLKIGLKL